MSDVTKTSKEFDVIEISEIKLKINPFPAGMYEAIMNDVIKNMPLPEIPQKEIDTFSGKETVDIESGDENYPEYEKQKELVEDKRNREMSERILKFVLNECLEVMNPKKMKSDIARLVQYTGDFPEDEHERQVKYISSYVLKTKKHYEKVIKTAIALSVIDDSEVAERLESFQD